MNRRLKEKLDNHIVSMYVQEKNKDVSEQYTSRVLPSQWKALEDAQLLVLESARKRQERMVRLGIQE